MTDPQSENENAVNDSAEKKSTARKIAAIGGGVLIVVAVVVGVMVASGDGGDDMSAQPAAQDLFKGGFADGPAPAKAIALTSGSQSELEAAAKQAGCTFNQNKNEGAEHQDPSYNFRYKANPPTSGNHTPTWAEDGAYDRAQYSTPYLVHGLEHGRIEYLWNPNKISATQLGSLKKLYDDDPYHLILHPNTTDMPYAIAAVAWDRSLTCPEMNDDVFAALRLFRLTWIDQAPEQVP